MKKFLLISLVALLVVALPGCADRTAYYESVKERDVGVASAYASARAMEIEALTQAMTAAGKTEDSGDDVAIAMMLMLAGQRQMPGTQIIEAPESTGDTIRKSAGMVLGVGALALGIVNSNNTADIAVAGINGAGTHTSTTTTGDSNSITNDVANPVSSTEGDIAIGADLVAAEEESGEGDVGYGGAPSTEYPIYEFD